mgnify:CR=1 FL=1
MFSQNSCNFRTNTNFCHRQYIVNKIYFHSDNKLTACSKCLVAKSLFLVCAKRRFPNCKCVREIMSGGGFMLKTDWRQWMHSLIFGGFDTLKFSAKPKSEIYNASFLLEPLMAAIFVFSYFHLLRSRIYFIFETKIKSYTKLWFV